MVEEWRQESGPMHLTVRDGAGVDEAVPAALRDDRHPERVLHDQTGVPK
jgi:hypothetical protein